MDVTARQPLVSIICFCKDRAATLRRSIDSVLAQSYRNIEFVVQDGASTDGTLEILRSYDDPRIRLVSQKDSGPAEAFWQVMNRCEGEIIGTCLSDEELLPGIVEQAVGWFREEPRVGAITCDGYFTDAEGKITGEFNAGDFNLVDYFFGRYCPFWPGSFFRRQALLDVGLGDHGWTIEALEFETWCRLGSRHEVKYMPVRASKYAIHPSQLSNTAQAFHEHFDHRAVVIRTMFSESGFFGRDDAILRGCLYNQQHQLYNHVKWNKLPDQEALLAQRLEALKAEIPREDLPRSREYFTFVDTPLSSRPEFSPKLYHYAATIYLGRGQVDQALALWRKAEALNDPEIDAAACQAMLKSPTATSESIATARKRWVERHAPLLADIGDGPVIPYAGDRRIRVAYLSAGDGAASSSMLLEVLRHADRERFTIVGYAPGAGHSLQAVADEYTTTESLSDADLIRMARRDQIDIWVETTEVPDRRAMLASLCAPIQVSSATLWRVRRRAVSDPPSLRRGFVTFGYCGSGSHVNLQVIELWAAILQRVPRARLLLRIGELASADNRDFIESRFRRFGITPDRLTLLTDTDPDAGAHHEGIDIMLDTWPQGGGSNVAQSLRQGVPVIALMTDRIGAREGASILLAAACNELVATTPAQYGDIAHDLAGAPDRLRRYRTGLSDMTRYDLAGAAAFARTLDSAYLAMMERLHGMCAATR